MFKITSTVEMSMKRSERLIPVKCPLFHPFPLFWAYFIYKMPKSGIIAVKSQSKSIKSSIPTGLSHTVLHNCSPGLVRMYLIWGVVIQTFGTCRYRMRSACRNHRCPLPLQVIHQLCFTAKCPRGAKTLWLNTIRAATAPKSALNNSQISIWVLTWKPLITKTGLWWDFHATYQHSNRRAAPYRTIGQLHQGKE